MPELLGMVLGLLLTLFIYSYLLGDNPLYRLALHLLVGVAAAYAAVVAVRQVLLPVYEQLQADPTAPASLLWIAPLLLALFLLLSWIKPMAWLGTTSAAALVGVGTAVALIGAITGTLLPQIFAGRPENAAIGLVSALFTICVLLYFQFTRQSHDSTQLVRPAWQRAITSTGRAVLMITFGALFAGVLSTSLLLLVDRLDYMIDQISTVITYVP